MTKFVKSEYCFKGEYGAACKLSKHQLETQYKTFFVLAAAERSH